MIKKRWRRTLAIALAVTMIPVNVQASTVDTETAPSTETTAATETTVSTEMSSTEVVPGTENIPSTESAPDMETVPSTEIEPGTEIMPATEVVPDTEEPSTEVVPNAEEPSTEVVPDTESDTETEDDEEIPADEDSEEDTEEIGIPEEGDPSLMTPPVGEHAYDDEDLSIELQNEVASTGMISPSQKLDPTSATAKDVLDVVRTILIANEGNYGSVNSNDSGHGISIGILQWNSTRALNLLKMLVDKDESTAKATLGLTLYNKIVNDTSWNGSSDATRFVPTATQKANIQKLLTGKNGKSAQDDLANEDIYTYITRGFSSSKLRNAAALAYFCDIANQCGESRAVSIALTATSLAGGDEAKVTLNEIHEAALMNSIAGAYAPRRYTTYKAIADVAETKKWNYYPAGSYRIPAAVVNSSTSKSEVSWLQSMLNEKAGASLIVDGLYGNNTKKAVEKFQKDSNLTVDGLAGQATITALIKAAYKDNFAGVTPSLVGTGLTATGVKVTWKKVTNATGYYVYRKTVGGGFSKIATIKSASTVSYTDKTVKNGTTYYYTIQAYNTVSASKYNTTGISVFFLSKQTMKSAAAASTGVKVTWNRNSSATGYYLYRKTGNGSYSKIATIKSNKTVTYTDTTAKNGKTYTYATRAYKSSTTSSYDSAGVKITYLTRPTLKSATLTTTGIKLTWTRNSSATGYYVYRKLGSGSYSKIATIKKNATVTYTDKTGKSGKKYTYKVYAYKGSYKSATSVTKSQTYYKTTKYKATANLNYRSGAGTNYAKKGTLKKGKTVYIVSGYSKKSNGYTWNKALISGKIYYLASKYVKK